VVLEVGVDTALDPWPRSLEAALADRWESLSYSSRALISFNATSYQRPAAADEQGADGLYLSRWRPADGCKLVSKMTGARAVRSPGRARTSSGCGEKARPAAFEAVSAWARGRAMSRGAEQGLDLSLRRTASGPSGLVRSSSGS